jgi:hypothetical protein
LSFVCLINLFIGWFLTCSRCCDSNNWWNQKCS